MKNPRCVWFPPPIARLCGVALGFALELNCSGQTIFVSAYQGGTVSKVVIGGSTTTYSGFNYPVGVAMDSSGNVYVANQGAGTISKIAPDGQITPFASGFTYPGAIAFDNSGNLFVANNTGLTTSKVPAGSTTPVDFATIGAGTSANWLAVDASGNVYVGNNSNQSIYKFGPSGGTANAGTLFLSGFTYVSAMAVGPTGDLFVSDWHGGGNNGLVYRISPTAPALDNVYVSGFESAGLAFDSAGNFYASTSSGGTYAGKILSLSPGSFSVIASPGGNLGGLVVTAVPEPQSSALLGGLCVAATAALCRWRRRVGTPGHA